MLRKTVLLILLSTMSLHFATAQEIISLPYEKTSQTNWVGDEKTYFSKQWNTQVVTNVSMPTMEVFRPAKGNGTSVIIAPGGGLYALSITNEGTAVAEWLAKKGITAFVLKYRLVPSGKDGVQEYSDDSNSTKLDGKVAAVMPLAIADGLAAIQYVRKNAAAYKIDPNKIGFMGFSAGGAVTMGVAYTNFKDNRPDFLVPVYPWTSQYPVQDAPDNAPPMLVICATDDPLQLAPGSIALYSSWLKANRSVALRMFSKGGHGFGMRKQGLPSDNWIKHFYNWAIAENIVVSLDTE